MLIPTYLINSNHFKEKNSINDYATKILPLEKLNVSAFEWNFLIISYSLPTVFKCDLVRFEKDYWK